MHDRLLMPGLGESNIDHLLVGPAGIVLVDAKNWAGHISEWNGAVYQHSTTATGFRQHRPLHREFAGVRRMATEVATRTGSTVLAVICLAGRQAADFGEPRVVQGVWVVPVNHLPGWLVVRPAATIPDRERLDVLVRTEFPSTTRHPALLEAIGRQLRPGRPPQPPRRSSAVFRAPRPASRPGTSSRTRSPSRRVPASQTRAASRASAASTRSSRAKPTSRAGDLLRLLGVVLLLGGIVAGWESGAIGAAGAAIGTYTVRGLGRDGTETGRPPIALDAPFACDDFDPSQQAAFRGRALTATSTVSGCEWAVPAGRGDTPPQVVIQVLEITNGPAVNPMIARAVKTNAPVVSKGWTPSTWSAYAWVAEGIHVRAGTETRTTTRNVCLERVGP